MEMFIQKYKVYYYILILMVGILSINKILYVELQNIITHSDKQFKPMTGVY